MVFSEDMSSVGLFVLSVKGHIQPACVVWVKVKVEYRERHRKGVVSMSVASALRLLGGF